jgi:hypothetical protein
VIVESFWVGIDVVVPFGFAHAERVQQHQGAAATVSDVRLEVALNGRATRLAYGSAPMEDAVEQLKTLAAGRADLLAGAAGQMLGGYLSRPGSTHPQMVYAVALLVIAGADVDRIVEHVDRARQRSAEGYRRR